MAFSVLAVAAWRLARVTGCVRRDILQSAEAVGRDAEEHRAVEADVVKRPVVERREHAIGPMPLPSGCDRCCTAR
jgi:hypothetical protein